MENMIIVFADCARSDYNCNERDEIAAYIYSQQAADPTFDAEAVWAEYRYELGQQKHM
jgi:hypothetical protein